MAAVFLDLSATLHSKVPESLPTPAGWLRALARAVPGTSSPSLVAPSPLDSLSRALTTPPIHVDHVAEAVCIAADGARTDVQGVVDVQEMRKLIGWVHKGQPVAAELGHD